MSEHTAAIVAFALAAVGLLLAFVVDGLHLSPRVSSPLSGAATVIRFHPLDRAGQCAAGMGGYCIWVSATPLSL